MPEYAIYEDGDYVGSISGDSPECALGNWLDGLGNDDISAHDTPALGSCIALGTDGAERLYEADSGSEE